MTVCLQIQQFCEGSSHGDKVSGKKKQLNVALVWKATNCGLEWSIIGYFFWKLSYHSGPSIGSQAEFWLLSGTCIDGIETCIKLVPDCYWYKAGITSGHTGLVCSLIAVLIAVPHNPGSTMWYQYNLGIDLWHWVVHSWTKISGLWSFRLPNRVQTFVVSPGVHTIYMVHFSSLDQNLGSEVLDFWMRVQTWQPQEYTHGSFSSL
jgi:hypothetical protein